MKFGAGSGTSRFAGPVAVGRGAVLQLDGRDRSDKVEVEGGSGQDCIRHRYEPMMDLDLDLNYILLPIRLEAGQTATRVLPTWNLLTPALHFRIGHGPYPSKLDLHSISTRVLPADAACNHSPPISDWVVRI